jgi:hypothetical protein
VAVAVAVTAAVAVAVTVAVAVAVTAAVAVAVVVAVVAVVAVGYRFHLPQAIAQQPVVAGRVRDRSAPRPLARPFKAQATPRLGLGRADSGHWRWDRSGHGR